MSSTESSARRAGLDDLEDVLGVRPMSADPRTSFPIAPAGEKQARHGTGIAEDARARRRAPGPRPVPFYPRVIVRRDAEAEEVSSEASCAIPTGATPATFPHGATMLRKPVDRGPYARSSLSSSKAHVPSGRRRAGRGRCEGQCARRPNAGTKVDPTAPNNVPSLGTSLSEITCMLECLGGFGAVRRDVASPA